MKLYVEKKNGDILFAEVNYVFTENEEICYYINNDEECIEELDILSLVKLDGEVLYRDSENELDLEVFVKRLTNVFMEIKEIEKRTIEEYKKEQENAK